MKKACSECNSHSFKMGTFRTCILRRGFFSDPIQLTCPNCGAHFDVKVKTPIIVRATSAIGFFILYAFLILSDVLLHNWLIFVAIFAFSITHAVHESTYISLELSGLRRKLKNKGVNIDPQKAANLRKT